MRVAIIGAGGFRTPLVYGALLRTAASAEIEEVVLFDRDPARLALIQRVLDGLAAEAPRPLPTRAAATLDDAVRDARYVLCAVRPGGLAARIVDETVPLAHGVLGQETVGPGGIAFALRTLPAMREIAEAVDAASPAGWLINFTNPAGMITESIQAVLGERAIGICDSPSHLCTEVADALGVPEAQLAFDYAGLNHLGWLMAVSHAGRDRLPGLLADGTRLGTLRAAGLFGQARLRRLRAIPNEYLYYYERPDEAIEGFQRAGATRGQVLEAGQARFYATDGAGASALRSWRMAVNERNRTYMAETRDDEPAAAEDDDRPPMGGYEAVAMAVIEALEGHQPQVMILDVANRGTLPFLGPEAVVEVPCAVTAAGARPLTTSSPPAWGRGLLETVKDVEQLTIRASRERSRALAIEALALHPLVPSARTAEAILSDYLAHLPDLAAALD